VSARIAAIFRGDSPIVPEGDTVVEAGDEVFCLAATRDIRDVMRELRRMDKPVQRIMIAGGGNIGLRLARALERDYAVRVLEHNKRRCETLASRLDKALVLSGDATDEELLEQENIGEMDLFCAVTNDDENNIMSCLLAKRMGASRVVALITRIFFGLRVSGKEKLPKKGPFILSPNHQSFLDGPVVASQIPWRLFKNMFYVGTSEIFGHGALHYLGRTFKLVPVDPDSNLVNAMRAGAFGLKKGQNLVLYPEGERSVDGSPKKFKKGAAILAAHLRVPIYPVALGARARAVGRVRAGRGRWQGRGPRARRPYRPR
jgi:1-acyl-sn-glycerol-3-phosphate acyltransferase